MATDTVSTEDCGMWMDMRITCMLGDGYVDSRRARYIFENFCQFWPFFNKKISILPRNYVDKKEKETRKPN